MTQENKHPTISVVGSVNLDLSATVGRLPAPGETVTDAAIANYPGGKGANQALAARRLGAEVYLHACVGDDTNATQALSILKQDGVNLENCVVDKNTPTGLALICVAPSGENQIVVAPGANRSLHPEQLDVAAADALICQLEVPVATIAKAVSEFDGFVCLNLAPAKEIPADIIECADLIIVNETEAEFYGKQLHENTALLVITKGAKGASLYKEGTKLAVATPPKINAVDATGAGDTFTAALTVALIEGQDNQAALDFACAAGACTATKYGAQPSLPWRKDVFELLDNISER
jgi:ribokinase